MASDRKPLPCWSKPGSREHPHRRQFHFRPPPCGGNNGGVGKPGSRVKSRMVHHQNPRRRRCPGKPFEALHDRRRSDGYRSCLRSSCGLPDMERLGRQRTRQHRPGSAIENSRPYRGVLFPEDQKSPARPGLAPAQGTAPGRCFLRLNPLIFSILNMFHLSI